MLLGGNSTELEFPVEQSLLKAVEKQDLPREDAVLKDLCDLHPTAFGEPGSNLRRDMQEHWNNLRRRKIRGYVRHLKRFGVDPSLTTSRLALSDTNPSDTESEAEDEATPVLTVVRCGAVLAVAKKSDCWFLQVRQLQ